MDFNTINVTNNSNRIQDFFFFQEPAIYTNGAQVFSNSLYHAKLRPHALSGAVLTFKMSRQYFAGAQNQAAAPAGGRFSGDTTACQPIELASSDGTTTKCATSMSIGPLGLSPAASLDGVQPGAFRIVAPIYNPKQDGNFHIGSAVQNAAGGPATVSSFIVAQPNQSLDCQPVLTFYVQAGACPIGQMINFTSASDTAAACDMSAGDATFNVTYNVDGTWSVSSAS